jgi:hypothetical protein
MFRTFTTTLLVLLMQTGFYLKAGDQASITTNLSNNLSESFAKEVLFVVKHSKSPNMVVYEAKKTSPRELDPEKPVDVYWLMQTKGAVTEALTLIEWKMAFGFKLKTILKGKKYKISLNAIKNKDIYITQDEMGRVEGHTLLNGVQTRLKEVFVKFEYSLFWPDVKYVDFKGIDIKTGKLITQRFARD